MAGAIAAAVDSFGHGKESGQIKPSDPGQPPDVDVYRYVAPVTQSLEFWTEPVAADPGDSLSLALFDQAGAPISPSSDEVSSPDRLRIDVTALATYFIAVSAGSSPSPSDQAVSYQLVYESAGHGVATASPLTFPASPDEIQLGGVIGPVGDQDWFQFVAPVSGLLTVGQQATAGSELDSDLNVFDAAGRLAANDDAGDGTLNSLVNLVPVTAGQTYYVEASASFKATPEDETGAYLLTITLAPQVAASHDIATPAPISLSATDSGEEAGTIAIPGVDDYYSFTSAVATEVTVRESPTPQSPLDTLMTVYDDAQDPIGTSDDFLLDDLTSVSQLRFPVAAGQTYVIRAGGFGSSTGPFLLSFTPDAAGDTPQTATPLDLSPDGSLQQSGTIEAPGEVDDYSFVAPITGEMTVQQDAAPGSLLDSRLTILDSSRNLIAFDDDSDPSITGNPKDSLVQFPVEAGQTYIVEAAAFPNPGGVGAYGDFVLDFATGPGLSPGESHDTFEDPHSIDLASGYAAFSGSIDASADSDMFAFVAPASESVTVQVEPGFDSPFVGELFAFDASRQQIASDYNQGLLDGNSDGDIQFDVEAGQEYDIEVGAFRGNLGAFDLSFAAGAALPPPADEGGQTFATAEDITLEGSGSATLSGTIDEPSDVDYFKLTALETQTLTIRMFAAPGSRLDTYLFALTDSGSLLAQDDDSDVLLAPDGIVEQVIDRDSVIASFPVVAGKTYYFEATSGGPSTGAYFLAIAPAIDDFGDQIGDVLDPANIEDPVQPASVQLIALDPTGAGTQDGIINMPGDLDAFQVTATVTGLMMVQEQAAPGSPLDSYLYAFDSTRAPLANNNDYNGTYNSLVQFNVEAGQTYYLKAAAYGISVGAYVLTLSTQPSNPSAPGASFATAAPLVVSATGPTVRQGTIVAAGDAEVYLFTAPVSGTITVQEQAAPGSPLDSYLYAYNGSQGVNNFDGLQALIASDDDSQGTLNSLIQFNVTAGQPYYLIAAAFGTSIGAYVLTLNYGGAAIGPQVGHTFADAGTITLEPSGYGSQTGVITSPGDADMYRFVAPYTGMLSIRQVAPSAGTLADKNSPSKSILDGVLTVFDAAQAVIAENDDDVAADSLNSYVDVPIVAGQTYYVQAAGYGSTTGNYELLFNDDVPNDFANASLVTINTKLLSATVFGMIEVPNDVDMYRFVAPVTGPIVVTQQAAGDSLLDSYLFLYDGSQTLIASDDDETIDPTGPGGGITIPDSLVQANVVAGQTYYIRAASSNGSATDPGRTPTGAYRLQVTFPAFDFGETFADARTIPPPEPAVSTQAGNLLAIGEVDMFQFAASESGAVTFDVDANPGTTPVLDPIVVAYDAQGDEIARGTNALTIGVQAGSLHYIQVGGYGASTGGFVLSYSEQAGDGLGLDFGSAIPVSLSGEGAGESGGVLGPAGDVNVFQFAAPATGAMIVTLAAGSPDGLAAFTISNGKPTQIAADTTRPGLLTFAVAQGQTYYVRVTSNGSGGGYRLDFRTSTATGSVPDLQLPGKSTYVEFGQSYTATIVAAGPSPTARSRMRPARSRRRLVAEFIASEQGPAGDLPAGLDRSGRFRPDRYPGRGDRLHGRSGADQRGHGQLQLGGRGAEAGDPAVHRRGVRPEPDRRRRGPGAVRCGVDHGDGRVGGAVG